MTPARSTELTGRFRFRERRAWFARRMCLEVEVLGRHPYHEYIDQFTWRDARPADLDELVHVGSFADVRFRGEGA